MRYVSLNEKIAYTAFVEYMARVAEDLAEQGQGQEKTLGSLKMGLMALRHYMTNIFNDYFASNNMIAHYSSKGWTFSLREDEPFFKKNAIIMTWGEAVSTWKNTFGRERSNALDTIDFIMSLKTS